VSCSQYERDDPHGVAAEARRRDARRLPSATIFFHGSLPGPGCHIPA